MAEPAPKRFTIVREVSVQACQIGDRWWVLVLDRGEEVVATVTDFLAEKGIRGGLLRGIGGLKNVTIAWYDLEKQEYVKRTFEENMELGNLTGTIGTVDGKPFLHAHATVSGAELIAFSGHLVRAEVGVTAELFLHFCDEELPRIRDEEVGLNLFRLLAEAADEPRGENEGAGDEA